VFAQSSDL